MSEISTGIQCAIAWAGNQTRLAELLAEASGEPINQSLVSYWNFRGHVSKARAELVSRVTGVHIHDLLKPPKPRKARNGK